MKLKEFYKLNEAKVMFMKFDDGNVVKVFKSPSVHEFEKMLRESKAKQLRGIVYSDSTVIYLWDAWETTHSNVTNYFALPLNGMVRFSIASRGNQYVVDIYSMKTGQPTKKDKLILKKRMREHIKNKELVII